LCKLYSRASSSDPSSRLHSFSIEAGDPSFLFTKVSLICLEGWGLELIFFSDD
jgi:hypothetical protein